MAPVGSASITTCVNDRRNLCNVLCIFCVRENKVQKIPNASLRLLFFFPPAVFQTPHRSIFIMKRKRWSYISLALFWFVKVLPVRVRGYLNVLSETYVTTRQIITGFRLAAGGTSHTFSSLKLSPLLFVQTSFCISVWQILPCLFVTGSRLYPSRLLLLLFPEPISGKIRGDWYISCTAGSHFYLEKELQLLRLF